MIIHVAMAGLRTDITTTALSTVLSLLPGAIGGVISASHWAHKPLPYSLSYRV